MSRDDRRRDARRLARRGSPATGPGAVREQGAGATPASLGGPAAARPLATTRTAPPPVSHDANTRAWAWSRGWLLFLVAGGALLVVAAAVRLWDLPLAPFHNDEGVNGWFTTELLRTGTWSYDPANYHGPTLFYAAAASAILIGLSDVSMRLVPAVFGLGLLALVLLSGRWIGRAGALAAALLLAFSPGMVFFSRYAIHEMLLVFFTLGLVLAAARWWETGRTRFLLAASASAAGMFTTKETAVISIAVLALAAACVPLRDRLVRPIETRLPGWARPPVSDPASIERPAAPGRPGTRSAPAARVDHVRRLGGASHLRRSFAAAALLFVAIWVVLFSSLFTHLSGVADSLRSLAIWTQTSSATQVSGPLTYAGWMVEEEVPLLALGVAGAAFAAWDGRSRFGIFAGAWAVGLLLAYSLIGYKTPWLMLNWLVPFGLAAGSMLGRAWEARRRVFGVAAAVVLAGAVVLSASQAFQLAFRSYDDEANAYVYAGTKRSVLDLVAWIRAEDGRRGAGGQLGVVIMSPDYWPLPWYLRDDEKAGFYGSIVDVDGPVQIVRSDQVAQLPDGFADRYAEAGRYELRGGVELVAYLARS